MSATCETGCECSAYEGLGLCPTHLDEWLRSSERRALPAPSDREAWESAMDRFCSRKRRERKHVN